MKSRNVVQSVMRNDKKAQGPERKRSSCTIFSSGPFSIYSPESYTTAVTSGFDDETRLADRGLRGEETAFSGSRYARGGYETLTCGDCWISPMERCFRPAEEMLLLGLGGDDAFGENGCEMTESWARPLLPLLPRSVRA